MAEFRSELYFRVAFIPLLLSLVSGDCVDLDLGMENGTISDSEITASSVQSGSTPAKNGRLNNTSGSSWCAATSDSNPYLQIDLQTLHVICAVSTQGNSQADQWVKNYTLKLSKDGSSLSWTEYEEDGKVKTFEGNNDRNSEVRHTLYKVLARYLRFLPKTHYGQVCMRTEVFGVKVKPENLALGKSTAQSSTFNSSAATGVSGNAVDGNPDTDFQNGHCSHTDAANLSWWRVDLGEDLVPVSEIFIVNRFSSSSSSSLQQRNKNCKITLGSSSDVTKNVECEGLYSFVDFKASAVCYINPLITGRYVGIITTKSQILQLCEVEVYSRENLAFGKPTNQWSGTYREGKSYKAVDGNSDTDFKKGKPEGSCSLTDRSNKPWWRVDLQQVEHVSEVYIVNRGSECGCPDRFKNFEIKVGQESSGTSSANPTCGGTYTNSLPVGKGTSFFCHPSLKGRYVIIRILKAKSTPLALCEVEVYSERRACPMQAIGVASKDAFPDNRFSALSASIGNVASKGRLNGAGVWSPSTDNNVHDYLQIDLLYEFVICAVATQGNPTADHWTTKYKLQLALIENNWIPYQEDNIIREFNGNSGRSDTVKHTLKEYASGRFIQFQPTAYNTRKALRVEVYGILISAVPSQAPSNFTVAAITSTSIKASWQLPPKYARHGPITGFKLFYAKKASQGSPNVLTNNVTSLSRVVSGLDKYTGYEFQVLAFSSKGDGPKSSVVVERTKEDVPSGPPANFNVIAISSTSVTASWELPQADDRKGIIKGFKLFYKKKGSSESETVENIISGSIQNKVVTGLDEYTEYEFEVLAYTSVGDGPRSSKKYERTKEDAPSSAPVGFTVTAKSSTSISASWQLPPAEGRNGDITGFKLFYKKKDSSVSLTMVLVNDGSIRKKVVSELDVYTEYQFQVLAYTSVGDGPKSSKKYVRTNEGVPSAAPSGLTVTVKSSTTITASWQLPPANARNGIIKGFKLFYKKKDSPGSQTTKLINGEAVRTTDVSKLSKYTEYDFQVLAFTSVGDGPKSTVKSEMTQEDAPSIPTSLTYIALGPDISNGPRIKLTWQKPAEPNGVIKSYTVSYSHSGNTQEIYGINALNYTVKVLGGVRYQFSVRAMTIKPGPDVSSIVKVPEYRPSVGPANVSFVSYNKTVFNISWVPLTREKSYGKVILYDVKQVLLSTGKRRKRSASNGTTLNTTATFVLLYDLPLCSWYNVFVRAYTRAGPGPYSQPIVLETSKPEAPTNLKATNSGSTEVTLEWTKPQVTTKEGLDYTVKYTGTKLYNKTFEDTGYRNVGKSTKYKVAGLVPGSNYQFQVYGTSVCGQSDHTALKLETKIDPPIAPAIGNVTDVTVTEPFAGIYLWPVEQRNGPISAYQVIVLKVVDGVENLPDDYDSKLKDSNNANKENLYFYITAEFQNVSVYQKSWEFTVGDNKMYEGFVNKALEKGEEYVIFQRAVTRGSGGILAGVSSKVAKISITPKDLGATDESKHSGSPNAAAIAVPVVLLLLFIPAVVVAVFWYRRRKQSEANRDKPGRARVELDELRNDSPDLSASTSNLVYQNVAQLQQPAKAVDEEVPPSEDKEAIYSEAEDGNPKPIPVAEFARYFKNKSENGAIVLREEFKNLPGGMQFPWEIGKSNRVKNRYGNIVSYDHSRVVLEKIEGDLRSDYINASYIPTFDEVSMCYIATQGPTASSINDFWRMIWQENCLTIVMLTNLVELGKAKCDQYWPENTTKYGSITATLHKTENFADYVVRTVILVKNSEKREVHQFHYVTWPDKGVPQHSTALLGFRSKIHARHQATGGPLVVHCSAGVGRTGTYIAIDAMLEGAKENKSVFIQNYVQVMRRCRPHMVQKDDQYVFLHQAVMEALVGGDTEIAPHDLRITMNKLDRIHKASKKTGYAREFKRLEHVTDIEASPEEATAAFKPSNIDKNRFPNIVPLDIARVFLKSSDPDKNYVNASFVDDYRLRNAYIITQAPLDNTVEDFWRMISQYDIGTVVMLNSLREGKETYPQYWPAEGSQVKHGDITIQTLSENASDKITTRKFSVSNAEPPKKTSTVNHLQFTGWANSHSCPDTREILALLTAIQHSQQQTGNGVIVFQCSDGVGRSGCVSTIMSVIERVKSEQTVDVFQTVKLIRAKRPGAVLTLEQYMFCYQTIQAYLDSFNTYANFADC